MYLGKVRVRYPTSSSALEGLEKRVINNTPVTWTPGACDSDEAEPERIFSSTYGRQMLAPSSPELGHMTVPLETQEGSQAWKQGDSSLAWLRVENLEPATGKPRAPTGTILSLPRAGGV